MATSAGLSRVFGNHSTESDTTMYRIIGASDGGWSLTPMENLLRGVRSEKETLALEIYSSDGVLNYSIRSQHGSGLVGMLKSYFPQAKVSTIDGEVDNEDVSNDWFDLGEVDHAFVQTLYLQEDSYLPLRIYDDADLRQSEMDPLAGVLGLLGNSSRGEGEFPGFRLGVRLMIRPAKESWNMPWRNRMQERRDGDDRPRSTAAEGPPMGMVLLGLGAAAIGGVNFYLWQGDHTGWMVPVNMGMLALGAGGLALGPKFSLKRKRPYIDDSLIDDKLKSLAFYCEMQLVAIYRHVGDSDRVRASLSGLIDCLRSYDHPVGNSWRLGRLTEYHGMDTFEAKEAQAPISYPFRGGRLNMDWMSRSDAMKTVLSAREVASLWHPPLGTDEMASMERSTSVQLIPFLGALSNGVDGSGPHVGDAGVALDSPICLPESATRKHTLILGRSGVGKSTMVKHILQHKMMRKAQGLDDSAIVVVDPHADLVQDLLYSVPPELVPKIRLLDFGRLDRVPGINLLDPELFTDRDRCVDTIVTTLRYLWEAWGNRLEDLLKRSLLMLYEYNAHADTPRDSYMTMMDILKLLDDGVNTGGKDQEPQFSAFQNQVISRVKDPSLISWFRQYLNWGRETKGDAVGPVHSRIGAYESNLRSSVIMGQRESTLLLSDVLEEGLVLFVSTAQGTIGVQPAALMGGTMVSLVESALRDQESIPAAQRKRCMLVCDEFQTVTGANWEGMLAEVRKYGGSLVLATQSVVRLDQGERRLKSGVLANTGCIISYQVSAEDAHVICEEMNAERVAAHHLVDLDPHHCIVRINSDTKCYQAFSMKTKPPPEATTRYESSYEAVIKASDAYTVDWAEARKSIEAEGMRKLHGGQPAGEPPAGDSGQGNRRGSSSSNTQVDVSAAERRRKAAEAREAAAAESGSAGESASGGSDDSSEPGNSSGSDSGGSRRPPPGRGPRSPVPPPSGAFSETAAPAFGATPSVSAVMDRPAEVAASEPPASQPSSADLAVGSSVSENGAADGVAVDRPATRSRPSVPLGPLGGAPLFDEVSSEPQKEATPVSEVSSDDVLVSSGQDSSPNVEVLHSDGTLVVDSDDDLIQDLEAGGRGGVVDGCFESPVEAGAESLAVFSGDGRVADSLNPSIGVPGEGSKEPDGGIDSALVDAQEVIEIGGITIPLGQLSLGNFYDVVERVRSKSSFSEQFIAELERVGPRDPLMQVLLKSFLGDSWSSVRRQAAESAKAEVRRELGPELEARFKAKYADSLDRATIRIRELHGLLKADYGVVDVEDVLETFRKRPTVEDVAARTDVQVTSTVKEQKAAYQFKKQRGNS